MGAIEKTNATPLYLQLKNKIKKEIRTGMLKPGDKLPSETQLQKEYNMSRVTVRNAMEELTVEGYIIKVQGKGSCYNKTIKETAWGGLLQEAHYGKHKHQAVWRKGQNRLHVR